MEGFLIDNYEIIIAAIVALFTAFKWVVGIKYVNFAKEAIDVYAKYDEYKKDGWTDEEDRLFGVEVREAIESGKGLFKK